MGLVPIRFIEEPIEVSFNKSPLLEKIPGCPDEFLWHDKTFQIIETLSEWHDYSRKGHMVHNMTLGHAAVAKRRGSWGVGKDYYRVLTEGGRIFELYFDRAPKGAANRKGGWFLYRELVRSE
ncbi:MAG: hypothetical protein IBX69_06395 [Anaerolineales bacterium]|nr:hypothetical protein [Anaerolineales bacterium]